MLTVLFPNFEAPLEAAGAAIEAGRDEILARAGEAALGPLRADFEAKSRGGTGADGVRWAPRVNAAKGGRIGVLTGALERSLDFSRRDGVLAYQAPHAPFFDRLRPLLPDRLPVPVLTMVEQQLEDWAVDQLQEQIDRLS